ncbi:MAG: inorganic phosphate transporter [Acidobacteria bacterium RIFCSPLOWO2_12_FULL_67_14]|nr:MAG: inorganic phosphate transporter [Acidobacteria bacterium RIFCSPLOWO2_02_FULL_67_21]OFW38432.1 MAG: inorganic phosphate transporter [Acidobacteria bacterium RIFCSPLOWO2_12_FULL_67_14]
MDSTLLAVIALIAVALIFDFINGFHDAANSIATVVSTRVLTPGQAVLWAAAFNFLAAFGFGTAVATTVGSGMIDLGIVTSAVIFGGLMGAIVWDLITWWVGLPTSSSHALVGGYAGAAIAKAGWTSLVASGWTKTLIFIVLAPLLGMSLALVLSVITLWMFRDFSPRRVDSWFRRLQLVSAALYSLGHGTNDAQKTMGIIAGVLLAGGYLQVFTIPFWVIISAHIAIALGTLSGGWRIVHTMGAKITKLQPFGGFAAETAGAITLFTASSLGIPVSTTHTITGAIVGVGAVRRMSAVRWGVAGRIVWAWIFTIPASAAIAALTYRLLALFGVQ